MTIEYAALASTIKIEDITSNKQNQYILHRLKNNDTTLLYIKDEPDYERDKSRDFDYISDDGEDLGWLGYFIGQNTKLQQLNFYITIDNESFYKEMSCNKSIQVIKFCHISLDKTLQMLNPSFLKNNYNLVEIAVYGCNIEGCIPQLSVAIEGCNKSLKNFCLHESNIRDGQLVHIITALSLHPQLEDLYLCGMNIGRNEYTALSNLLRCSITHLKKLSLNNNNIDDEGVEHLVNVLSNGNKLEVLDLSRNAAITIKGWKKVSILLERPRCALKRLYTWNNNIGNEGALVFAEALINNSTLETFIMDRGFTVSDWEPFSKLLCDTSSPNSTYLSNHTLQDVGQVYSMPTYQPGLPNDVQSYLELNKSEDKGQVAMKKILKHHSNFDMNPFFEWEFKVLPIMISWFTKATLCTRSIDDSDDVTLNKRKLSAIYDFIREFPMLYIEPKTRQELAEYSSMEMLLRGSEMKHTSILEEIQRCKTNALMRL